MKLLVIGSGGMLGHMIVRYMEKKGYDVTDISKTRKCREATIQMDILDEEFSVFMGSHSFDVVINCAAVLFGDKKVDLENALAVNSVFPHRLKKMLVNTDTYLIHISTGGVFKGDMPPYSELCGQDTISVYGKTKSLGEIEGDNILVIRSDVTGPHMSPNAKGLFNWGIMSTGEINGFANMRINGVTSLEYAAFIRSVLVNRPEGFYNLCSAGNISKADFLKLIKKVFNITAFSVKDVALPVRDNTLLTLRNDIAYRPKSYEQQMLELREWIENNIDLYPHYKKYF